MCVSVFFRYVRSPNWRAPTLFLKSWFICGTLSIIIIWGLPINDVHTNFDRFPGQIWWYFRQHAQNLLGENLLILHIMSKIQQVLASEIVKIGIDTINLSGESIITILIVTHYSRSENYYYLLIERAHFLDYSTYESPCFTGKA